MKYLYSNYYIALTEEKKVIARFTKKEDAFQVLPSQMRCFGGNISYGTVVYVGDGTILFSSEKQVKLVFESVDEYYREKKEAIQRKKLLIKKLEEEIENEK